MNTENKTKPANEIRLGSVRATLWLNQSEKSGAFYNVTFTRLYKSGDAWKRSESFGQKELPLLKQVAEMALQWITEQSVVDEFKPGEPDALAGAES